MHSSLAMSGKTRSLSSHFPGETTSDGNPVMAYSPSFLREGKPVDVCIREVNEMERNRLDDMDVSRITTSWIHRLMIHAWTKASSRECRLLPKV